MNLNETKNYSVGSIRTVMENYMKERNPKEFKNMKKENTLLLFLTNKSENAMDSINTLMNEGFRENETWEIVSKEIVFF